MDVGKWDDLRFVLAVAEAGSVNAAASRLQVNHATILRRVASFEQAHGTTIFTRNAKGYAVAPDAVAIIDAIRDVEKSIDAMERVISGKGGQLDGIIRMTSTDSLCQVVLPEIIRSFHRTHPDLTIELHSSNAHLNFSKLDAELTIRPAKKLPAEMVGKEANVLSFRIYGTPTYLNQNPSSKAKDHKWLGVTDLLGKSPVGQWQSGLPKRNLVFMADSFVTLAEMADTGLGLAMLPTCLGEATDSLIAVPNMTDRLETKIWVACHYDMVTSPRVSVCMDYFARQLAGSKALA